MTPESELRDILMKHGADDGEFQFALMAEILGWHRRYKERELQSAYRDIARRYFDEDKNLGQLVEEEKHN